MLLVCITPIAIDYNNAVMMVRDWISLVAIELIVQYKKEIIKYL
jgi:hypothetical protein